MNYQEKQRKILEVMQQCRTEPLKRVHFAWALPIPEHINPQPFFRITFKRQSHMYLQAAFDGKIEKRCINAHEAVFFRLFGWDNVISYAGTESLAIVYRPDFIRIVLGPKTIVIHNPHSLSAAGFHTLQLLDAFALEKNMDQQLCCTAAKLLLDITCRDFSLPVEDTNQAFNTFLEIKHFLAVNYVRPVNRDSTAEHFGISPGYISQLFKRYSDTSFQNYLTRLRLDKVEYFLLNSSYTLTKIAELSGFSCDVRLIKNFHQHYGTSPARFRLSKKHRTLQQSK